VPRGAEGPSARTIRAAGTGPDISASRRRANPVASGKSRESDSCRPRSAGIRHALLSGRGITMEEKAETFPSPAAGPTSGRSTRCASTSPRSRGAARPAGAAATVWALLLSDVPATTLRDRLRPFYPTRRRSGRDGVPSGRHLLRGPSRCAPPCEGAKAPFRNRNRTTPLPRDNLGARGTNRRDGRAALNLARESEAAPPRSSPAGFLEERRGSAPVRSVPGCGSRRRFRRTRVAIIAAERRR